MDAVCYIFSFSLPSFSTTCSAIDYNLIIFGFKIFHTWLTESRDIDPHQTFNVSSKTYSSQFVIQFNSIVFI